MFAELTNLSASSDIDFNSGASLESIRAEVNGWFLTTHCHECQTSAHGLQRAHAVGIHHQLKRLFAESALVVGEESTGRNFIAVHKGAIRLRYSVRARILYKKVTAYFAPAKRRLLPHFRTTFSGYNGSSAKGGMTPALPFSNNHRKTVKGANHEQQR